MPPRLRKKVAAVVDTVETWVCPGCQAPVGSERVLVLEQDGQSGWHAQCWDNRTP